MPNDFVQMTRELEHQATVARRISEDLYFLEEVRVASAKRLALIREAIAIEPVIPEMVDSEGRPY